MANNKIKGLTIEIGGDTTKLGKALDNVNNKSRDLSAELGQINRMLKLDPGNTELLAQKQKVLADAVENTKDKLDTLREAEKQVQEQFKRGEVSEAQVRELQREIIATTKKLDQYENAIRETTRATDDLGDASEKAARDVEGVNTGLADFVSNGLKGVVGAATAAATALVAMTESTREYRTEMAKLNTAFTDNGHTAEAATTAYKELQSVLGETDQAVEAANHLAKLTDNEKDLATWTGDILPGVFATFGASLPIEGLTEAANETAKVGAVTGPLADALNWAGVSEDAFNESLAKCTTEQERQALITETLNGLYGEASAKYKEVNADVIAANQANEAMTASMAAMGEELEPLLTELKLMGAQLLVELIPAVQFMLDNLPIIGVAIAGVTAAIVAFKIAALSATLAEQGLTIAQWALNAAMSANPVGLIILAITGLITVVMLLWKNVDGFRAFWINAWEKIKGVFATVVGWVKEHWQGLLLFLLNPALGMFYLAYQAVGKNLVEGLWGGVKDKLAWLKGKLKGFTNEVLSSIKSFFGVHSPSTETAWIGEMLDKGLAEGVADNAADPVKAMRTVTNGVLGAAEEANGLSIERSARKVGSQALGANAVAGADVLAKLDSILSAIERGQVLTIDGTALVGSTATKYDAKLGQRRALAARGAL